MRFAHMADLHIGGWRDPLLQDISFRAFARACDICIREKVDFILIAGDIFNTSLPSIDSLKGTVKQLKILREHGIPVYIVPGSHDYSPSGKTMLDVIEETGLWKNVVKGDVVGERLRLRFTIDGKTGAKITGLLGKRAALEKGLYSSLDKEHLEQEQGFRIFLFHSGITELKPSSFQHVETLPLSFFPKGFDYYAGGHIHTVSVEDVDGYGKIAYPGPLFPNSFSELEELGEGGFYLYLDGEVRRVPVSMHPVVRCKVDCGNLTPEDTEKKIVDAISALEVTDALVTLRLHGKLASGKASDIDIKGIFTRLYDQGAYVVMKNLSRLESPIFDEIKVEQGSLDEVEDRIIKEHAGQHQLAGYSPDEQRALIRNLMDALHTEKKEGETVGTFEDRLDRGIRAVLGREKGTSPQ
ncbi:MAG: DNA repair exonuclease [DPANN group archaeon]|nr:DNA repair exonuclease [DPANN group archaeon]